jgi:hypothetical protein
MDYDALGRTTHTRTDSELGTLTAYVDYQNGFVKRTTDARGNFTYTRYQAFDEPSESAIASMDAPKGVRLTIARDSFGKPTAVIRSGPAKSATRHYVYDAYDRLCKQRA